jgi:hypothetical protein
MEPRKGQRACGAGFILGVDNRISLSLWCRFNLQLITELVRGLLDYNNQGRCPYLLITNLIFQQNKAVKNTKDLYSPKMQLYSQLSNLKLNEIGA